MTGVSVLNTVVSSVIVVHAFGESLAGLGGSLAGSGESLAGSAYSSAGSAESLADVADCSTISTDSSAETAETLAGLDSGVSSDVCDFCASPESLCAATWPHKASAVTRTAVRLFMTNGYDIGNER